MKNSDVTYDAMRVVRFDVKEDSGSFTFDGVIPEDVKSFSAILHFEDFPSSDVGGFDWDVLTDLCRPLILEDGHVECKTVTFQFRDACVSGYLKSVEITEKPEFLFVQFEFIPYVETLHHDRVMGTMK